MAKGPVTLSMKLEMRDALSLARFEVETGIEVRQHILELVREWEKKNGLPSRGEQDG